MKKIMFLLVALVTLFATSQFTFADTAVCACGYHDLSALDGAIIVDTLYDYEVLQIGDLYEVVGDDARCLLWQITDLELKFNTGSYNIMPSLSQNVTYYKGAYKYTGTLTAPSMTYHSGTWTGYFSGLLISYCY